MVCCHRYRQMMYEAILGITVEIFSRITIKRFVELGITLDKQSEQSITLNKNN